MNLLKDYVELKILLESKQNLINIGYPPVFASIIMEKYGNIGTLIGKWMKDYYEGDSKNWFKKIFYMKGYGESNLSISVKMYESCFSNNIEEYLKTAKENGINGDSTKEFSLDQLKKMWKESIKKEFLDNMFFRYDKLIIDITSGKLKDLSPYKNLSYFDALEKYEKKNIFNDSIPIKKYKNGYKWIDVGSKCNLIGKQMKNCGSSGVMSSDPDKTILVLFDENNTPHVLTTYSPNQKRISGIEGQASSSPKSEYNKYVLDLAKFLDVTLDAKSKELNLSFQLKNSLKTIKKIKIENSTSDYFKLTLKNNSVYVTDSYNVLSIDDFKKAIDIVKQSKKEKRINTISRRPIQLVFSNIEFLKDNGVKFIKMFDFVKNN